MKKSLSICLVILSVLSLASCKAIGKSSYEHGLTEYQNGAYADACNSYKTAISQGYKNEYVYADLAIALYEIGAEDESKEYLEKALESDNKTILFSKKIGVYYYMANDTDNSILYLNQAIEADSTGKNPDALEAYGIAAAIEMNHECYDEAVRLYNYLIEHDDHILEHTLLGGICYLHLYQFSAAQAYFDLLLDNPDMTPYHYLEIYNTCVSLKGYEDAKKYFNRGLELIQSGSYPMTVSEYYAAAGAYEEAKKSAKNSQEEGDLLALSQAYLAENNFEEANKTIELLFSKNPNSEEGYLLYFISLIQNGQYEDAKQAYQKLLTFEDSVYDEDVAWNEVILFEKMRDYSAAYEKLKNYMILYHVDDAVRKEMYYLMEQSK